MKKLVILDANHLMHRAYWAIQRSLSTSTGEPSNAVFGVASMLLSMLQREHPDSVLACFDEGKETVRHQEHDEYKAGRAETPDDFYAQLPRVHQCLDVFGIPTFSNPKYEADDFIGTLALHARDAGYDVIIVTGDKDLFQMADGNIRIAVPHKGYNEPEYLDAAGVETKLGVPPHLVPDYKGLTGDPSDNLKGVKGIGPKTAVKLLKQYGDLEGIYEHIQEIKGTTKTKLSAEKESAFFCRRLARLITDIDVQIDFELLHTQRASLEAINQFFAEMEFHTLGRRLTKVLESDAFAAQYFTGEHRTLDVPEDVPHFDRVTEAELPLLD